MRRLLLAVALALSLATAAQATTGRVAVVYPSKINRDGVAQIDQTGMLVQRNLLMLRNVLEEGDAPYFLIPSHLARNEHLRTGVIAIGSEVDTVLGVIHASFCGNLSGSPVVGNRADSLMRSAYGDGTGPRVPQLFLIDNVSLMNFTGGDRCVDDSAGTAAVRCSTGVLGAKTVPSPMAGAYLSSDPSIRIVQAPYSAGWRFNSRPPAGGVRPIVQVSSFGFGINDVQTSTWPDSMPFQSELKWDGTDTVSVWERPWAHITGAKSQVFCDWFGAGALYDSLSNQTGGARPFCEGSIQLLMAGLARFDSLCGGVFRRPLTQAIVFNSAASRGLQRWNRGIAPSDTSYFYSSLDSLNAWGVPVTFYVNPDSTGTYERDVIKLKGVGGAKFSPQVWDGCFLLGDGDSTAGKLMSVDDETPRDVFGQMTARAIYGDGSGVGADSSVWAQYRWARNSISSTFGAARLSNSIKAPFDDWSPRTVNKAGSRAYMDSLLWMFANKLNAGALVVNGQSYNASLDAPSGAIGATNPRGGIQRQGWHATALGGHPLKVLAHNGGPIFGGTSQWAWGEDSTLAGYSIIIKEIARAMAGHLRYATDFDVFFTDDLAFDGLRENANYTWPNDDMFVTMLPKRGSIVNLSCADLSGQARSGLWITKYLWNTARMANSIAGRTVYRITYPEGIRP